LATFLTILGNEGLKLYDSFNFESQEDRNDVIKIIEKFDEHTKEMTNILAERYKFLQRK